MFRPQIDIIHQHTQTARKNCIKTSKELLSVFTSRENSSTSRHFHSTHLGSHQPSPDEKHCLYTVPVESRRKGLHSNLNSLAANTIMGHTIAAAVLREGCTAPQSRLVGVWSSRRVCRIRSHRIGLRLRKPGGHRPRKSPTWAGRAAMVATNIVCLCPCRVGLWNTATPCRTYYSDVGVL
ncbi:putative RNA-directed DNA polymerase from transposon BS [Fusarium oxysporum f. sp. albedinis]|nr:putative RNA-directed DNA polymerase from transposon BS [Fusarium oxysporum f. sp. albedinis]